LSGSCRRHSHKLACALSRCRIVVAIGRSFTPGIRTTCRKPALRGFDLLQAEIRGLCGSNPALARGNIGTMLDLLIRGGEVITPQGVVRCDVAVAGETIAAIAAPDTLPAQDARRVIDAGGLIVMPGGIDPHVHLHHVWIKPDGTPLITAGP